MGSEQNRLGPLTWSKIDNAGLWSVAVGVEVWRFNAGVSIGYQRWKRENPDAREFFEVDDGAE